MRRFELLCLGGRAESSGSGMGRDLVNLVWLAYYSTRPSPFRTIVDPEMRLKQSSKPSGVLVEFLSLLPAAQRGARICTTAQLLHIYSQLDPLFSYRLTNLHNFIRLQTNAAQIRSGLRDPGCSLLHTARCYKTC